MNKTTFFLKLAILFILPITLFFISGCASNQAERGTDWETWVGELTGMVDPDLKMSMSYVLNFHARFHFEANLLK
jgi:hypothetical protein